MSEQTLNVIDKIRLAPHEKKLFIRRGENWESVHKL